MSYRCPSKISGRMSLSLAIVTVSAFVALPTAPAFAQPEPTFHSTCENVRDSISAHSGEMDFGSIINVEGNVVRIETDGALYYVAICANPDPEVVCVTYGDNGNVVGDRVIVSGRFSPQDEHTILLDPCLHGQP